MGSFSEYTILLLSVTLFWNFLEQICNMDFILSLLWNVSKYYGWVVQFVQSVQFSSSTRKCSTGITCPNSTTDQFNDG